MTLHAIDLCIIVGYIVTVIALGWMISRRASRNLESYFLGGKSLPWYIIGVSHGASGFDITGTMWFVMMFFTCGAKAVWILWFWPMFAMIFRMMYLGVWIRRSNVLTGAEWMRTRFGSQAGGNLAHISVVIYAVMGVIGFLSYAFKGIGKFASVFLPWGFAPETYATVLLLITAAYLIVGGLYSVILTDLVQFGLLIVSAVAIAVVAFTRTSPESIAAVTPDGWGNVFFGWKLDLDWSGLLPAMNAHIEKEGLTLFGLLTMMLLFKGILVSMAGPAPGYGMQHVLATRSPREAALESWWISVVAFFPRFLMIAAIVVLGLVYYSPQLNALGDQVDFEQVLPLVIQRFIPVGLTGLVVAGLLAAFMSTFDSTVNAGSAYIVNDIYKRYVHPGATPRHYVKAGYVCSILVVLAGIFFGFLTDSISSSTKWIVSALFGGFTAPNILKWHWWRFNGYGFFAGMIGGTFGALFFPLAFPSMSALESFPWILAISAAASVIVCLTTRPESDDVLKKFYLTVRPWGFWKPVREKLREEFPDVERNGDFGRDMMNCAIGIVWQTSIVTTAMFVVLRDYPSLIGSIVVLAVTSVILKKTWYDHLSAGTMYLDGPRAR